MDNIVTLSYLSKDGGYSLANSLGFQLRNLVLLTTKEIRITVEYFPSPLIKESRFLLRAVKNLSDWKLYPNVFQKICGMWRFLGIDVFVSRICYQIPTTISWKLNLLSKRSDALQMNWTYLKG